jgi:hypothetical protein
MQKIAGNVYSDRGPPILKLVLGKWRKIWKRKARIKSCVQAVIRRQKIIRFLIATDQRDDRFWFFTKDFCFLAVVKYWLAGPSRGYKATILSREQLLIIKCFVVTSSHFAAPRKWVFLLESSLGTSHRWYIQLLLC